MPKAKRKRRAKSARRAAPPAPAPTGVEREPPRRPREADSVEDPLEDWPEDEDDRWLRERSGGDIEKPDDGNT